MIQMSRVSKKKLIKILKGEYEHNDSLTMNKQQIFDMFKNPPTQEQWLTGYKQWKRKQNANN